MSSGVLIIILLVVIVVFVAMLFFSKSKIAAAGVGLFCLLLLAFSVFGFLASFEPLEGNTGTVAKAIYAGLFLLTLVGAITSVRKLLALR